MSTSRPIAQVPCTYSCRSHKEHVTFNGMFENWPLFMWDLRFSRRWRHGEHYTASQDFELAFLSYTFRLFCPLFPPFYSFHFLCSVFLCHAHIIMYPPLHLPHTINSKYFVSVTGSLTCGSHYDSCVPISSIIHNRLNVWRRSSLMKLSTRK
jgi:hypothetical protein